MWGRVTDQRGQIMFLGHFAAGVAAKPVAPELPIWALLIAPQALDLAFLPLVAVGVEGFDQGDFGQDRIDALYTHSLIGALVISAAVFWIAKKLWKSDNAALILTGLSFSHWPIDLLVHHEDLPILPNNWGDFSLLGFGLWDYPRAILSIEIGLAVVAAGLYFRWARVQAPSSRWYVGPAVVTVLFALLAISDLARLPA